MLNGKEELINCIVYKTERNYSKSIAQLLEYNVELLTQQKHIPHKTISNQSSAKSDMRLSIQSFNTLNKDNPQQSLNLVMMQVNDRFLMDWCGVEGEKSRLVDYLINKFLGKLENEDADDQRRATRFFQMFIDKIFDAVDKIDPNFITQQYVFHALAMLYHIADHKEIMSSNEIKGMFYTEHATNAIFTLIIKEYDHIE